MKALTVYGPSNAKVEETEKKQPEGDMVLIKVKRTGICATDLAEFTGNCSFVREGSIKYPVRIGHEYSGIVEAVGKDVTNFKAGDRVYSDCAVTCGKCPACLRKDYNECKNVRSLGTVNTWDGCFAEYMYMPEHNTYHLPDSLSYEEGALIEPSAIAYEAFRDVKITNKDTIAVIGCGTIGLISVWLAKYFGAGKVIMVGREDSKLEIAKKVGADIVINTNKEDAVRTLKNLTDGKGATIVIEASGSREGLITAIYSACRYGIVALISFYDKNLNDIPMDYIVLNCLKIKGTAGRFGNPQKVCEIMVNNPIKLLPIITHRVKLDDCIEFFKNESSYHKEKIKAVVNFD